MPPKRQRGPKKNQDQNNADGQGNEATEKTEERTTTEENQDTSPKADLSENQNKADQVQEEAKLPETSDNIPTTNNQETEQKVEENKVDEPQAELNQATNVEKNEEPVKTEPETDNTTTTNDTVVTEPTQQEQEPIKQQEEPVQETKPEEPVQQNTEPEIKKEESPVKQPEASPRKEEPNVEESRENETSVDMKGSMTTSQWVTVPEKSAEKKENPDLQQSLGKSWAVVDKSDGESAHSDRALDNAYGTRIIEESSPAQTGKISFDDIPQVTPQTRIKTADENIQKALGLVKSNSNQEAIKEFLNVIDTLNPEYFKEDKEALQQANQRILECTCEIAGCYNTLNNHEQSGKYARAALDFDAQNLRAIYYHGASLVASGKSQEALTAFRQSKSVKNPKDVEVLGKIQKEIERLEAAETKATKKEDVKTEIPKKTEQPVPEKKGDEDVSGAAYFVGSLISTGLLSFYVTKLLKFPTQKGIITSIGVGVAAGALSLLFNKKK